MKCQSVSKGVARNGEKAGMRNRKASRSDGNEGSIVGISKGKAGMMMEDEACMSRGNVGMSEKRWV